MRKLTDTILLLMMYYFPISSYFSYFIFSRLSVENKRVSYVLLIELILIGSMI